MRIIVMITLLRSLEVVYCRWPAVSTGCLPLLQSMASSVQSILGCIPEQIFESIMCIRILFMIIVCPAISFGCISKQIFESLVYMRILVMIEACPAAFSNCITEETLHFIICARILVTSTCLAVHFGCIPEPSSYFISCMTGLGHYFGTREFGPMGLQSNVLH